MARVRADKTDIGTDGTQSRAHGFSAALYGSYQPGRNDSWTA